jgi:preprotein translocase subunit SecA
MSTNTSMEASLWEKLVEGLSGFSDAFGRLLLRVFGSSNERVVRKLGYIAPQKPGEVAQIVPGSVVAQVNDLEARMRDLTDEELAGLTPKLRERLAQGATLDDLLPEAFAACREAGRRTKNMRHYDVQILGGAVLHKGNIAEMVTGEGKTLVATLPAYLNGLSGKGVHIITVNDYLARRDCEWMLPIYRALGLTAGYIQSDMEATERRQAYESDITYGTNSEFGFDYLRDNMKPARWDDPNYPPFYRQCQRELNYAIIDEVDNILIDEARTPLIISGAAHSDIRRYGKANDIAVRLSDLQKKGEGPYFEVKEKEHTCHLTDEGVHKAEELAGVESFYTAGNMEWPHLIDNSLRAHHLYKKDKNYAVIPHPETGELSVIIIDEFTGRLMVGRQWSDGLHQAVEAKHATNGVKIKEETQTLATITLQNFFKLYRKISGMTGTAMTEANEFWKIYKLDVIAIPTNRPLIRLNSPDLVYRTEKERWRAVVEEIEEVNRLGRPILVGTTDVEKSEKLSEMLERRGIRHELLNAKPEYAAREAEIVAQAGRIGAVTISTNMAGRGTDIILGGNPEYLAWAQLKNKYATRLDVPEEEWKAVVTKIESETREIRTINFKGNMREEGRKVAEMGGLHIVGTERHEARRIDNQLRGRAGRQGDPGSSRFFVSLEDDLMRIFGGEWVQKVLGWMGMEDGQAIESRMVSKRIEAAQKKIEERNFDIRKHLLEYDEVMDTQRKRVYGYRQQILEDYNCKLRILDMIEQQVDAALMRYLDSNYGPASFAEFASKRLGVEFEPSDFSRSAYDETILFAFNRATREIPTQIQDLIEENLGDEDPRQWNWQALANQVKTRWSIETNDRKLKQIGKDNLAEFLITEAEKAVNAIDLSEGKPFLEDDWGLKSLCDWARRKFQIELDPKDLASKEEDDLRQLLLDRIHELYHRKEIEFPVQAAMATFMAERAHVPGQQRYDREGLYNWARVRFPQAADDLHEDEFRTLSRAKLYEKLLGISRKYYPEVSHVQIDEQIEETFAHAERAEPEDARELVAWARSRLDLDVKEEWLTGQTKEQVRSNLWNSFDVRYRPEMRSMERSLLLHQLDTAWKNQLYAMDHLREGMRMMWVGQIDAKTEYKRQGMKEFESMWEGVNDKVTDTVFRMEEATGFEESIWAIGATIHESAPRVMAAAPDQEGIANSGEGKKPEPIRNRRDKVGRNDPCTCGSGKKYKNCCMRTQAAG